MPDHRPLYYDDLLKLGDRLEATFRSEIRDVRADIRDTELAWRKNADVLEDTQTAHAIELALIKQDVSYLKWGAFKVASIVSAIMSATALGLHKFLHGGQP